MKIGLTGPSGTGKSTIASHLSKVYQLPVIPEYAREAARRYDVSNLRDVSAEVGMKALEEIVRLKRDHQAAVEGFIADRLIVDAYVYWTIRGYLKVAPPQRSRRLAELSRDDIMTFDHIFLLKRGDASPAADGFRSTDSHRAAAFSDCLHDLLSEWNIKCHIIPYHSSLEEKAATIQGWIEPSLRPV